MFILCSKYDNSIICISTNIDYMDNGYPIDTSRNIAYPIDTTHVYENIEVSDDIKEHKYCYTPSDGFYLNKNYKEPPHTVTAEEYEQLASNVDYLLLLNDPDSATEESV